MTAERAGHRPERSITLGRLLRAARRRVGLLQREVAARAGISNTAVSFFEHDLREPRAATLARLAAALDLDSAVLERYRPAGPRGAWARVPWTGPGVSIYPDRRTLSVNLAAMRLLGPCERARIEIRDDGRRLRIEPCATGGHRLRVVMAGCDTRQASAGGALVHVPLEAVGRHHPATLRDGGLDVDLEMGGAA